MGRLVALQQAQTSTAQNQAEQVSRLAHAYATGVQHAAREARLSPPRSDAMSEAPNSVRNFDLTPRKGDVLTTQQQDPLATTLFTAAATNLAAKAVGSDRPTGAPTTTAGSVSGTSVTSKHDPTTCFQARRQLWAHPLPQRLRLQRGSLRRKSHHAPSHRTGTS